MTGEAAAAPEPEGPGSALGRLFGVFVSPVRTFAGIARRPGWLLPLALWTALSFLLGELVLSRTDWRTVIREGASRREQKLTDRQLDALVERSRRLSWLFEVFAAVTPALLTLATAGALWVACQAFGWELEFRQSFGVTAHAFLPGIVASIALLALLWNRHTIDPGTVDALLPTNPGFLVDRRTDPTLHAMLSSLDLLSLWTIGLLVVGLSAATGTARGRVAALVASLWGLYVVGKAGITALFS